VSGTLEACENPGIYAARKVPDTFFNRLLDSQRKDVMADFTPTQSR